ncbi:MAG: hypothetical protein JOZ03_07425, partial [Gammaproteobacteria bacterium]|nr:hypothetical protein [Gammaproteobacteria bacterium]
GWRAVRELATEPHALGVHVARLDVTDLPPGATLDFTFRHGSDWVGRDFQIRIVSATG